MEIPSITDFFVFGSGIIVFKILILILLFVYLIFLFIIIQRINALNRTISIVASNASKILQLFAVIQFLLALSLFFLTIVIV